MPALGATDCERITDGFWGQPVNTATGLGFVAAGCLICAQSLRAAEGRGEGVTLGATVTAVGAGSVLFHGPRPPYARWAHDLSILSAATLASLRGIGELRRRKWKRTLLEFASITAASGALLAASPNVALPLTALAVAVAALAELICVRRGLRRIDGAYTTMLGALALGAGAYLLGRSSSPLCDPDSRLQLHGAWHLLAALALAAYGVRFTRAAQPSPHRRGRPRSA